MKSSILPSITLRVPTANGKLLLLHLSVKEFLRLRRQMNKFHKEEFDFIEQKAGNP